MRQRRDTSTEDLGEAEMRKARKGRQGEWPKWAKRLAECETGGGPTEPGEEEPLSLL